MDDKALQSLLDETIATLGVAGAQLAIFDGERLRQFAAGSRDRESDLPVTHDTLFQIGSTTKVFNAATIMSLVDEGRLDLDTPVEHYIPSFYLSSLSAQRSITLRRLLSMSAGIDNGPYHQYGSGDDALGRYVAAMAGVPQIFKPGTAFGYSNASTNISGFAAKCVMGQTWEQLLQDRILTPLGLNYSATLAEDLLHQTIAIGYSRSAQKNALERVSQWGLTRSMAPAGGTLCCSAGDLVRMGRMFLRNGTSEDGKQILSPASVATMQEPQVTLPVELMAQKWCVGPYWKKWDGQVIYGHSGTNIGGSSMLLWCPSKNFSIATTVNVASQGYPLADRIFDVVFPALFGVRKPKITPAADIVPAPVDLQPFVGRFEAFGSTLHFAIENGKLFATQTSETLSDEPAVLKSELIPLGGARFVPRELAMSGNRAWDVAFWTEDGGERPTHFLNGMFPFRRTG